MAGSYSPVPAPQMFTNAGVVASGYKLFTYAAGTTTKQATYTDTDLTSANTNPILLDSAGRATIVLPAGQSFKYVLTTPEDTDPPATSVWTRDNINATEATDLDVDITGTFGGTQVSAGELVYLSQGDGSRTAGRWYKTDTQFTYASTTASAIGVANSAAILAEEFSIRLAGRATYFNSSLTAGTVYYLSAIEGRVDSSAPARARPVGIADTTSTLILSSWIQGTQDISGAKQFLDAVTFDSTTLHTGVATFTAAPTFTAPPIGAVEFSRSTSAFTKNANTTLGDVTGLAFAVGANETWIFEFFIHGISNAAADWKFAVTFPTTPTAVRYGVEISGNLGAESTATAGADVIGDATGVEEVVVLSGLLRNGANAGNVQLQAAQNTSNASDTIIRADSYVIAHRIA